jgi:hypothetical protein
VGVVRLWVGGALDLREVGIAACDGQAYTSRPVKWVGDNLAGWRKSVEVTQVGATEIRRVIHFTSATAEGYKGEIRVLKRCTREEQVWGPWIGCGRRPSRRMPAVEVWQATISVVRGQVGYN